MPKEKYTTIIFDFGGVIGQKSNSWQTTHSNIAKITGISPEDLSKLSKRMWPELETGKKSVHSFWLEVLKISPKKISEKDLEKVYENNFKANKEIINIAKKLKTLGYNVVLLSNASKKWLDFKIEKFQLQDIFTKLYNSADLGMMKPSLKIYKHVIDDLDLNPKEVIFIDDTKDNVVSANSLGISGIVYKNAARLKEDLESLLNTRL